MDLASSLLSPRRQTRRITLGGVPIGDGAPITVQSMTTTKTADVDGTLAQIYALAAAGADIVRCTCNEEAAAEGLAHIVPRSPVPIVADIHFHHEMALAALEAGVQGLRLNPGNLRKEAEIKEVAAEARDRGVPIRIGVNAGSLHPDLYKKYGGATPEALVESARNELALFEEVGFDDVKISVKASSVALMIAAYRLASETFDHPLHLGVTEAGPPPGRPGQGHGGHRRAVGRGDRRHHPLLADGRPGRRGQGGPPAARVARPARAQGPRPHRLSLLWPGPGRRHRRGQGGPRGAREAEPAHSGRRHGLRGQRSRARLARPTSASPPASRRATCSSGARSSASCPRTAWSAPSSKRPSASLPRGIEARLAAADAGAEAEAEADRRALIESTGADPNHTAAKIEIIRRHADGESLNSDQFARGRVGARLGRGSLERRSSR